MDLWNLDKLTIVIVFAIPGFLMLKTNAVLGLEPPTDSSKQIVDAVAFSCINYAVLAWPILQIETAGLRHTQPNFYMAFYGFAVLIAPVLLAIGWRMLRCTQLFQRILPHPTARPWDFVFRKRVPYWIVVTFKDGKQVAGKYSGKSFSSAAPAPEQLYLEEAWVLNEDGGFERSRTNSAGLLVLGSEVRTVEFFSIKEEDQSDEESIPQTAR